MSTDNFKSETTTEIDRLDLEIEQYKKEILLGTYLNELSEDPKFISLIEDSYFSTESQRVLNNLINPSSFKREQLANLSDALVGIRNLKMYFLIVSNTCETAKSNLEQSEEYRLELTKVGS